MSNLTTKDSKDAQRTQSNNFDYELFVYFVFSFVTLVVKQF